MSLGRRRVLCAEPHDDTCQMITMLLGQQGHEVKSARTIAECLELAATEHFDLYMIDDGYADGTNIELCRQLRRLTPATPILFFTTAAFDRARNDAMEAGAQAYLIKPSDILEIVQAVNAAFAPPRDTPSGELNAH
ncbi:MAG: response regulator transcription factor [Pyrinomonadaceae bacterium]